MRKEGNSSLRYPTAEASPSQMFSAASTTDRSFSREGRRGHSRKAQTPTPMATPATNTATKGIECEPMGLVASPMAARSEPITNVMKLKAQRDADGEDLLRAMMRMKRASGLWLSFHVPD